MRKDSRDLGDGPIHVVVDHHGVEGPGRDLLLDLGLLQTPGHRFRGLGAPTFEPTPLFLPARRGDEDAERLGERLFDREGAVDIDLEEDVPARTDPVADEIGGRALEVAVHLEPSEEAAGGAAFVKRGRLRPVMLTELPPEERAPVLKAWCQVASSGRRHLPVPHDAPEAAFAAIAADYPVFRVDPMPTEAAAKRA